MKYMYWFRSHIFSTRHKPKANHTLFNCHPKLNAHPALHTYVSASADRINQMSAQHFSPYWLQIANLCWKHLIVGVLFLRFGFTFICNMIHRKDVQWFSNAMCVCISPKGAWCYVRAFKDIYVECVEDMQNVITMYDYIYANAQNIEKPNTTATAVT